MRGGRPYRSGGDLGGSGVGARREGGFVIPNLYPHVMYGLLEILVGLGEGRDGGLCIASDGGSS